MQPLVSPVDHEARSHQYDENEVQVPNEYTPLIHSYPVRRGSRYTSMFVALMLIFLVFGVIISIFLFIEQDKKWHVNVPFEMVLRSDWGANSPKYLYSNITSKPVSRVIITHTNTPTCNSMEECVNAVKSMQSSYQNTTTLNRTDLPFNFFLSPFGMTFEGRGWDYCGEVDSAYDCTSYSVAAIGDYTTARPPFLIIEEFKAFLDEAIWRSKLQPNYKIIGRSFGTSPEGLLKIVRNWKHWSQV